MKPPPLPAWQTVAGDFHRHGVADPDAPGGWAWVKHGHFGGGIEHAHDEKGYQVAPPGQPRELPGHHVRPLDGTDDGWRCECGCEFTSTSGWAICPAQLEAGRE